MRMNVEGRNGSAMLTVLGIVSVVSIVCGMLGVTALNQARSSQVTRDMLKARTIAESGLNKAYHAIKENFPLVKGYQLTESFDGGIYKIRSVELTGVSPNRAQLFGEGVYGLGRVVVAADVENRPLVTGDEDGSDDFFELDYDLLVGGVLKLSGNFYADVTKIHSNGSADLGGSANLGSEQVVVSSAGTAAWKKQPANVTLLSQQPAQEIFSDALAAALDALKAYAVANKAVYASGAAIPFEPPGGIAYCTGPDDGWSGDGKGCFIFEGVFSGKHLNVESVDGYPSLVVLSPSSFTLNAGTVLKGAVILPNSSLKFNGHAAIYGPLLVGQTMTGLGTADLYAGSGQGFTLPPKESQKDRVVITAWH
ncbi:MAG: hypothetical protein WCK89_17120 [bacterium]